MIGLACKDVYERTVGAGFPIICNDFDTDIKIRVIRRAVERVSVTPLIYHSLSKVSCSDASVEGWLKGRRSGEEKRCMITDYNAVRGWEASHIMVVSLTSQGIENLVMRAVGYCALVKQGQVTHV